MMKKILLVIGDAGVRLRLQLEALPYAGEKCDGRKYGYSPDCLAGASALCAARMGIGAVLLTKVGKDANGTKLLSILSEKGVDTRYAVQERTASTSLTVVIDEDAADMRMIRYRGAAADLIPEEVEDAFNCYPDAVLLRLETDKEAAKAAERFAAEKGVPLYVSSADVTDGSDVYLPSQMKAFVGDAASVRAVTGIAPSNHDQSLRAALELTRLTKAEYVLFRMNGGCIYIYDGTYGRILDITSKGHFFTDVFAPALISEYMRCGNALAAARFAAQAASLWEACGETLDQVPTMAEVRSDAENM